MCPLRLKSGLAHLDRQVATVGDPLPVTLLPCFVLKMFISPSQSPQLPPHLSLSGRCWSCAPSCVVNVTKMCPPHLHPLCMYPFQCHFCLPLHAFLILSPLLSVQFPSSGFLPLFSCLFLLPPSPPSSVVYLYLLLCPLTQIQEHCL